MNSDYMWDIRDLWNEFVTEGDVQLNLVEPSIIVKRTPADQPAFDIMVRRHDRVPFRS